MITVRQLEILAAVFEHGSFRKCSQKLSISPVSVSDHTRALETQLGVELFVRSPGGSVVPTAAGARAFETVHELLAHVQDFANFVVGDGAAQGPIRIAMHGYMMRNLAGMVAGFDASHHRPLTLVSDDGAPEDLHASVLAGQLDAAYFYSIEGASEFGQIVGYEPLAIFVGEDHPLAKLPLVSVEQLSATPAVGLARDQPIRRVVDEALRRFGLTQLHHIVETSEFGLILSSLHRNLGYTCMFESIQGEEKQVSGLSILRCERPLVPLEIRRITRRSGLRLGDVRDAVRLVEQAFANT